MKSGQTINRRSPHLDAHLGKRVEITFWNKTKSEGILEYGKPISETDTPSDMYSLTKDDSTQFFRKSYIKKIRNLEE